MSLRMGSVSRVDCSGALTNMRARMICFCLCLTEGGDRFYLVQFDLAQEIQEFIVVFRKR